MPRKTPRKSKTHEPERAAQPLGENANLGLQYDRCINNTLTRVSLDNLTTNEPTAQTLPRRGPGRPKANKAPEQKRAEAAERARKYRNRKKEMNANNQREAEGSGVVGDTAATSDETVVNDQGAADSEIGPNEIQADTGDAMEELRRQLINVIVSPEVPTGTQDSNIASRATTEVTDETVREEEKAIPGANQAGALDNTQVDYEDYMEYNDDIYDGHTDYDNNYVDETLLPSYQSVSSEDLEDQLLQDPEDQSLQDPEDQSLQETPGRLRETALEEAAIALSNICQERCICSMYTTAVSARHTLTA